MAESERAAQPRTPERRTSSPELYLFTDTLLAGQKEVIDAALVGMREASEASSSRRDASLELIDDPDITAHISSIGAEEKVNASQADVVAFANRMLSVADGSRDVFVLTAQDLTAENATFVFGNTSKKHRLSIQSIYRFLISPEVSTEQLIGVTSLLTRHETGHLIGLDGDTIVTQDRRSGLYSGHCMNVCTMRQVMSVQEALNLNEELKGCSEPFCSECAAVLAVL